MNTTIVKWIGRGLIAGTIFALHANIVRTAYAAGHVRGRVRGMLDVTALDPDRFEDAESCLFSIDRSLR
ncbi:hypothetical protein Q6348_08015 [Isoptericola sp. b441]|uniref:Uncharacterized protein n=1 Tax=Actinotalea lenta TaxID=3064654 RepID=A0ABT9D989_9CELL|nr:hypothetical protein [Isoptericola sp. b441]MDO8107140.1 hypothetical protein [Isoptericola sp. b441]